MEKLNILIIEKSPLYKKMLARAVEETGLGQVARFAPDIALALEKLNNARIDVLLLDMHSPGLKPEVLDRLSKKPGINLIMMYGENEKINPAFQSRANEYIIKPAPDNPQKGEENLRKQLQGLFTLFITGRYTMGGASGKNGHKPLPNKVEKSAEPPLKKLPDQIDLVVIASSTGGPSALEIVLKKLPAGFSRPVLVVQHMPGELTGRMSRSLDKKCPVTVMEAGDGSQVIPGTVLVAPGGQHMTVIPGKGGKLLIEIDSSAPVNGVRPSADVLLYSIARNCRGKGLLVVILTGMGSDGMRGVKEVKQHCDCYCIAQSEKSCVVYGMPKSVVDAGLSDAVEDLEDIPFAIMNIVSGRGY